MICSEPGGTEAIDSEPALESSLERKWPGPMARRVVQLVAGLRLTSRFTSARAMNGIPNQPEGLMTARTHIAPIALAICAFLLSGITGCQAPPGPPEDSPAEIEFLSTPEHRAMGFPFSEAVRVDHMLYLSGQIGNIPGEAQLVEGGIQAETRQALTNIRGVLERYGSSMDRVVRCLAMVADMSEWPAMNEVYAEFFPGPKPARSALGANGLALGARVEIECTATVG
jgi:2-iminobutanoate/2-iminopropanoate deaminase